MKSIIWTIIILIILLFSVPSCSKGGSNPIQPDTGAYNPPALRPTAGRSLIGVWEIHLRSDVSGADVRLIRTAQSHENSAGNPDLDIEVDYEKPLSSEELNDYNPNFIFRDWVIYHLSIELTNNTEGILYDVRGIIMTNKTEEDALGLHNADGLTTLWDEEGGDDKNPFRYYDYIMPTTSEERKFQVRFEPPDIDSALDCSDCTWPGELTSYEPGGGQWDPDSEYIPYEVDDVWINFAVDASIGGACLDPYEITADPVFRGSLEEPLIDLTVDVSVHDVILENPNSVVSVSIFLQDLPGYSEDKEVFLYDNGDDWITILTEIPINQTHEGIYHGRIKATSALPAEPDPYNNPNTMYKDIRLFVGDFEELLDDLFEAPDQDLIDEITGEWDDREDDIYNPIDDGFNIEKSIDYGSDFPRFLLIHYNVGEVEEYGVLRIPPGTPPNALLGWPLMVFCHWGRFVCYNNPDGFMFYGPPDNYMNKFAVLLPRYRGNALCWDGSLWDDSPYNPDVNSPADWDVDDVLAFLNVVRNHEYEIEQEISYPGTSYTLLDEGKVGIMGGSRGGSPTYLAKIRDNYYGENQIDRALVTIGSVTDFLLPNIVWSCRLYIIYDGYVPEDTYHYYLTDYNVFARVLEPYLQGEFDGDTREEVLLNARKRLVRSSPVYFAEDYLTNVQVHHGSLDTLCRVDQTESLANILGFHGDEPPYTEFLIYWYEYHGIGAEEENNWPQDYTDTYYNWITGWFQHVIDGD